VFPLEVPPLRARKGDIAELAAHFVERFSRKAGRPVRPLSSSAHIQLEAHDWPGNIRELQNTIERALIWSSGDEITIDWPLAAPRSASIPSAAMDAVSAPQGANGSPPPSAGTTLVEVERQHIVSMLKRTGGVIEGPKGAAKMLDMKPSTMRYRIRKLGIRKTDYL
jgi:formate hydrogenlyase transcriptional activator